MGLHIDKDMYIYIWERSGGHSEREGEKSNMFQCCMLLPKRMASNIWKAKKLQKGTPGGGGAGVEACSWQTWLTSFVVICGQWGVSRWLWCTRMAHCRETNVWAWATCESCMVRWPRIVAMPASKQYSRSHWSVVHGGRLPGVTAANERLQWFCCSWGVLELFLTRKCCLSVPSEDEAARLSLGSRHASHLAGLGTFVVWT